MIYLNLKHDQKIMIGDKIEIQLCDIRANEKKTKIGIIAPKTICVDREEVRKLRDNDKSNS